ncbi:ROK family transcriptional regulator [Microbacterium mangrovi]|uniref:ROK family transcriptional regulator n=1 Tax=Microbacterium mangrovi TaxID=1348253 RepID=A0A0B2A1W4_9MICO|nr:ROK family protein [Microbacterium mangrovi]KHK95744.1 ROK family transcriptional regulator [Microbacterium mangrovi]
MTASILGPGAPALAFDVGGTDMKAALVDAEGTVLGTRRLPTPRDGERTADRVVEAVARLAEEFAAEYPSVAPAAAGLLVPGHVDAAAGVGVLSENLGWREYPFRERATAALGMPVGFDHDVRAAGEAEYLLGAASRYRDVLVVTIGTGIAAAVFIDGRIHAGDGRVGEIGHAPVADGPACACGGRGCLEAVASAAAIARRYAAGTGQPVRGAREVLARAQTGDGVALAVWESALDALALSFAHVVALLSPEALVIGGGLSEAGEELLEPLRRRLDARLTFHRRPVLVKARIGEDAGIIGAALKARAVAPIREQAGTR